uniref:Uncharacterized protein n=1 Tax=Plectus sambesii TaxID=2011161 RepID=A0A914WFL3_9BILA
MKRLLAVCGARGKQNDLLYQPPASSAGGGRDAVICFGGDIQDFEEQQTSHSQWTLDRFAGRIGRCFPTRHIFVVRPAHMFQRSFAVYRNFVESNNFGVPTYSSAICAVDHLERLLQSACGQLELSAEEAISDVILIGFSKGCVVLNQLLHELPMVDAGADDRLKTFASKCRRWVWLDGGHNGKKEDVWVTDEALLKEVVQRNIRVSVHVTPYQVSNPDQPWKSRQEQKFVNSLKQLGGNVDRTLHFDHLPPSIESHFNVIEAFCRSESVVSSD